MGKLHTLRRAIERDPESWRYRPMFDPDDWRPKAAYFHNGQWTPGHYYWSRPYRAFVRHVLEEIDNRSE